MTFPPPSPLYLGPPSKSSDGDNKPITRIVLHGTTSPTVEGGARNIAGYFRSDAADGSAHYVIDPAEVVQSAFDSVICWHAPPNPGSIGEEMCDRVGDARNRPLPLSRWSNKPHAAMLKLTARNTAELCLAYGVPARMIGPRGLRAGKRGICEHSDVSLAFKQTSHWDLGAFPRRRFVRMVRREIEAIKAAATVPAKSNRITKARDLIDAALDLANSRKQIRRARRLQAALDALPKR